MIVYPAKLEAAMKLAEECFANSRNVQKSPAYEVIDAVRVLIRHGCENHALMLVAALLDANMGFPTKPATMH